MVAGVALVAGVLFGWLVRGPRVHRAEVARAVPFLRRPLVSKHPVHLSLIAIATTVLVSFPLTAQHSHSFTRILVPIAVHGVPGQGSTTWSTALTVRNDSPDPVPINGLHTTDICCLSPRSTQFLFVDAGPGGIPGRFLYIDSANKPMVHFALRVVNVSAAAQRVLIPVIAEDQFRADTFQLLDIPIADDRFRTRIRFYDQSGLDGTRVIVRVFGVPDDTLLRNTEVVLRSDAIPTSLPFVPAYAELTDLPAPVKSYTLTYRVEIEPLDHARVWAFASVTSNSTQEVSIITPD